MSFADPSIVVIPGGIGLRAELSLRNLHRAKTRGFLYEQTDGDPPAIIFGCDEKGRHGNFHPLAYKAIVNHPQWARRLDKAHTASRRVRPRSNWQWKELDCANSSDALLMNIFCYPGVSDSPAVCGALGVDPKCQPEFGFKPRAPLQDDRRDNSEIDMKIGDLLIEAKLTESDFQRGRASLVSRYRDLVTVCDTSELPLRNGRYTGYQLIRATLAAHSTGCAFCVLCDARRSDLIEAWYLILRTVRIAELRCRLKLLTWQELAGTLPLDLRDFLEDKYGIVPARPGLRSQILPG